MIDKSRDWEQLKNRTVLVIGDLILDRYTWGNAERVSPEAPVLVLSADEHEVRPGGAASVAFLLRHLDTKVILAGVVGDDPPGESLLKILDDEQIDRGLVIAVADRPTTTKERFVGRASNRHSHQILRVDRETRAEVDGDVVRKLCNGIRRSMAQVGAVVVSDYAKGVCTPELLKTVIHAAREYRVPVIVDPARVDNYRRYRGATVVTPNRSEAELAANVRIDSPDDAVEAGQLLVEKFDLGGAFVTLDRDGIAVVERGTNAPGHIEPVVTQVVYDITGAGDMVVAVTGLCQAAGWPLKGTAHLANLAAGLEIEQVGIAPVTWDQIATRAGDKIATKPVERTPHTKIVSLPELLLRITEHRSRGESIVFTNGCFDLLHVGHVTFLQEAAALGDLLIVAINSDPSVRRLKGSGRPVIHDNDRARMLAALTCVDYVIVFDDDVPHNLLRAIHPEIFVKGGTTVEVIGREVVESYAGKVHITTPSVGVSTSLL